ncbi:thioesterase II family protein [Lentzea sp. JNUCC 0626]|uniref:thioesterase II family protein n=1 Tax=Lentzea sp. JNUCC 0626 TaxID=3367513 RepID=UPI003749F803
MCVPWSGAGPGVFNRWAREMPDQVELLAVVLPRSTAWRGEDAEFTVEMLSAQLCHDLLNRHGEVEWLAVFGHSLGALVAFDLVTRLQAHHMRLDGVIVSGSRAAHLDPPVQLHQLDDDGLTDALIELGGLSIDLRYDTSYLNRVLPRVRTDLTACERYRPSSARARLTEGCRMHAWAATGDWYAPATAVQPWHELAHPGHASIRTWDGDHFFVRDLSASTVLDTLGWPHGTARPDLTELERVA